MYKKIISLLFLAVLTIVPASVFGQATAVKPSAVSGEVTSITDSKIVIKTGDSSLDVILSAKTEYKRVPPENPVLKAAVAAVHSDIVVGDKLLVTGVFGEDKKVLPARSVYLMAKSDIAQKNKSESEKWTTRGVSGKITAVNAETNQVTLEVRGLANTSTVILTPKPEAKFLRYAPNSVKYNEAIASSLSDLQAGDMLRAVGEKSADGTTFAAEEIISGAFQTIAGTVKSVDAAKNEVVVTNTQTKKDVTIDLGLASVLKKFPEEMATRMAQMQSGGGGMPAGAARATRPEGAPAGANGQPGGQGRGFGGGRSSIDEMLERFPNITAADLKPGDVIAVSSSKSQNPDRITAIKLLAGVEPFLRAAQATNGGGRRGQGGQADGGFTIPGLDGFGGP